MAGVRRLLSIGYGLRVGSVNAVAVLALVLCLMIGAMGGVDAAAGIGGSKRILVLGDSLASGYGLRPDETFPARLKAALLAQGFGVDIINGGVSGDTTRGGLARLDWALATGADAVIVELGANDGLRGTPPKETYANLARLLGRLKARNIPVLLTGMMAPPNLGREYGAEFNAVFPRLAERFQVPFYRFFLEGVASDPDLNQKDGVHPNARGVEVIVQGILPLVMDLVKQLK